MPDPFAENEAIRRALVAARDDRPLGWEKSLIVERDAVVLPHTTQRKEPGARGVANGGVYRHDGTIVRAAVHQSGPYDFVPDHWPGLPDPIERLAGTWLFGGVLRNHFGHFMLESLARLWGLAEAGPNAGPIAGIVFIQSNAMSPDGAPLDEATVARLARYTIAKPFVRDMLRLLVGDLPVRVVGRAVRVDELVIPSQLIGNDSSGDTAAGHPDFRAFVADALRPLGPPDDVPRRRLYVSRARLPPDCISFLFETRLEEALAAEGYDILYPETLGVVEQIAAYRGASHLVMPTGSAIHLAAYAMTGTQRVAVINRGHKPQPKFARQLALFGAAEVVEIGRAWGTVKDQRAGVRRAPAHILDLDAVWTDLRETGFVAGEARFDDLLEPGPIGEALAALRQRLPGSELTIVPR